jgi:cytoskeletal protein CcmA (bactofilin family)
MFRSKPAKPQPSAPIHTLIGKDTLFQGEVHTGAQSLRVEGTIEGTIHSEGEVTVGPSGLVTGTIKAKHLIVTGKVRGVLDIRECLEIHGTGCVEGEVTSGTLVVDEGGTLQGTTIRRDAKTEAKAEKNGSAAEAKPLPATGPSEAASSGKGRK